MKTTLIKIGHNEYRVQDILPYNTPNGVKSLDYGVDFDMWINNINDYKDKNSSLWYKIEIDEFENFDCGIICVWNRNNHHQFEHTYKNLNPIMNFSEDYYPEQSQNEYVNLLLNLHKLNIVDNLKVKKLQVCGNKYNLWFSDIEEHFKTENTFLVKIYSYGYNNTLIAEVSKNNFTQQSIPKYDIFENRYLKLLKNLN